MNFSIHKICTNRKGDCSYSCHRQKPSWVTLGQSLSLSSGKEAVANHFHKTLQECYRDFSSQSPGSKTDSRVHMHHHNMHTLRMCFLTSRHLCTDYTNEELWRPLYRTRQREPVHYIQ